MDGVLIFAGTTEGRMLTEYLGSHGVKVHSCVVTDYGRSLMEPNENVEVSSDRLGMDGMCRLMTEYPLVVDATHPYAVTVTKHIKEACDRTGAEYVRLLRPGSEYDHDMIVVHDVDEAVRYLEGTDGNILVTTGSKDASKYIPVKERLFIRVLPNEDSIRKCTEAGIEGKRIICMQGPFSEDLNLAMIRQTDAKFVVTKDSGQPGGMKEKISAAKRAGAKIVLIGRPTEESGLSFDDTVSMMGQRFGISVSMDGCDAARGRRVLSVVGIGMGYPGGLTLEAREAIMSADLVVGARRMVESVGIVGADILEEYASEKILDYLSIHTNYRNVAVLVSGDVGFYSAATKLLQAVDRSEFEIRTFCGISSMVYLCGRMGIPWQDVHPVSAHGRDVNIVGEVNRHPKVFCLLQGSEGAKRLCSQLVEYGMDDVTVTIGQDLGSVSEKVFSGIPSHVIDVIDSELCVALVDNPGYSTVCPIGIPDEELIRGDAPMTKSEVRSISVAKLKLSDDSVVYDVGAGTGSVSVEMASVAVEGKVYAIEKDPAAVELIELNKKKFRVPNIVVVQGLAPESMRDLPVPTHAFIGGSSGNLKQILEMLLFKNKSVRVVINSVTLETLVETMNCVKELGFTEEDVICMNVSRGRRVGGYHLMTAQNPVYVVTCRGAGI